jgi:hypothetical protein
MRDWHINASGRCRQMAHRTRTFGVEGYQDPLRSWVEVPGSLTPPAR